MKSTGIVRRMDDLGRVVIPKDLRRSMKIKEGAPLEIYTYKGAVCFKPYTPVADRDWEKAREILKIVLTCGFSLVDAHEEEHCRNVVKSNDFNVGMGIVLDGETVATLYVNADEAIEIMETEVLNAKLVLQKLFADEG